MGRKRGGSPEQQQQQRPAKQRRAVSQEKLLSEAVETERENQRWLEVQRRAALAAHAGSLKGEGRARRCASRRVSRRGCYVTVTFPETELVPAILLPASNHQQESSRSRSPPQWQCVVTNGPAKYKDPQTLLPFADLGAFQALRSQTGQHRKLPRNTLEDWPKVRRFTALDLPMKSPMVPVLEPYPPPQPQPPPAAATTGGPPRTSIASLNSLIEQKTMKDEEAARASESEGEAARDGEEEAAAAPANKEGAKARRENGLRRGKWTVEEEAYANRLIHEFKLGLLPLTDGTTLRTFLSKLLHCDPMRISKKFVGSNCIGKQVFRRRQADMDRLSPEDIKRSRYELAELERRFLSRVAQTNRTSKTTVASTTAAGPKLPKGERVPDFTRQQPISAPWLLPPHPSSQAMQPVRATPGAGAVAIATPYGLGGQARQQGRGSSASSSWQQPTNTPPLLPETTTTTTAAAAAAAAPAPAARPPAAAPEPQRRGEPPPEDDLRIEEREHPEEQPVPPKTRLELGRSNLEGLPARASQASLASFDLPSLNSMDNLASLDAPGLGTQSPWSSSAKLATEFGAGGGGALEAARHPSEGNLAAIDEKPRGPGLSSWPSFSALVNYEDNSPRYPPSHHQQEGERRHPEERREDDPPKHRGTIFQEDAPSDAFGDQSHQRSSDVGMLPPKKPSEHPRDDAGRKRALTDSIRRSHRNSSVENFFSLVQSGDIPAPDEGLLTEPILQHITSEGAQRHKRAAANETFAARDPRPPKQRAYNPTPRS
ncbi:hypothetical protein CTAYLR_005830 [Chrysophaeum taylorii]|uniref:Vps72/YL1 C-terminal domain-containing protein n=1 Tax=Chrysophaeum taylorii TaxID=2483200 RepID=A0AAD7XRY5_9STRA|nr:hypothetical protein CTAYLR_005830 [Chrysophaeum taylorii]